MMVIGRHKRGRNCAESVMRFSFARVHTRALAVPPQVLKLPLSTVHAPEQHGVAVSTNKRSKNVSVSFNKTRHRSWVRHFTNSFAAGHGDSTSTGSTSVDIGTDRRRSDADWQKALSTFEFDVLRCGGTERAYSGTYDGFYPTDGYFACRGCSQPLYASDSKFSSGCGWPAFDKFFVGAVTTKVDTSHGMIRREILCSACDGHLGHVFTGERCTETNQRHCVNSVSLVYVGSGDNGPTDDDTQAKLVAVEKLPQGAFDFASK